MSKIIMCLLLRNWNAKLHCNFLLSTCSCASIFTARENMLKGIYRLFQKQTNKQTLALLLICYLIESSKTFQLVMFNLVLRRLGNLPKEYSWTQI